MSESPTKTTNSNMSLFGIGNRFRAVDVEQEGERASARLEEESMRRFAHLSAGG